jgi:hypothetical protein
MNGEAWNENHILVEKYFGRRPVGRLGSVWEYNIYMDFTLVDSEDGPICVEGNWRIRTNKEMDKLRGHEDVVGLVKPENNMAGTC